ncbi:sugar-binding transcriptional regulator [Levilactobacillus bambusae]|uniref:Citrate lyase n=1 Tax=Levilactobacillus bambusae TaxID=2024736 RepID=A0A2V1N2J4_9LACO|nr:sugar-binding domain-containing protein [Levilactobacillus bambusae]PWG00838.1 citrate lyase [Levilactobacillus bambusae]
MENIEQRKQQALIAQDFYLSHMSIADLSKKYHLSRYLITKGLDEAMETGLVDIKINAPLARNYELEASLKKQFPVPNIYILKDADNPNHNAENVIQFAAGQAQLLIEESHIVGLAWGATVFDMIDHCRSTVRDDLTFTQFMGENMRYNSLAGSMRMVEKAASKFNAHYVTMVGPLYMVNDEGRQLLQQEPAVAPTFSVASRMDCILTGIGTLASVDSISAWRNNKSAIFPGIDPNEIVGMLYGRPYDINGTLLNQNDDKVLGVDMNTIMAVPRRLGVIKSKFKSRAALGALRGGLLTDAIMDEAVANRILMEANQTE